jgi:geranylgeranyl pyrophosphate synthase
MSQIVMPPEEIENFLDRTVERYLAGSPTNLAEAIRYSLLAPGKRIRPRLMLASAQMLKLDPHQVVPAALSIEMIHCFTLIHDDLPCMDDDDFRRGIPSNHKKFGEALALLSGDALIGLAIDTFLDSQSFFPPAAFSAGLRRFSRAIGPAGVCGGQAAELMLGDSSSLDELYKMHEKKTGSLFSASILIPTDFAGISDDSTEALAIGSFARELGLAFQIADDLADKTQDTTSEENAENFTSILHFLGEDEVRAMTQQRLKAAVLSLRSVWRDTSESLSRIAEEVLRTLQA